MSKITKRWRKQAEVYKIFAQQMGTNFDFSESAAEEMFKCESLGQGDLEIDCFSQTPNGYAVGKKWLNVCVAQWKQDIEKGLLVKSELYADPLFANVHFWLDNVLKDVQYPYPASARAHLVEIIAKEMYPHIVKYKEVILNEKGKC